MEDDDNLPCMVCGFWKGGADLGQRRRMKKRR